MWSRSSRTLIFVVLVLVLILATHVASPHSYSQSLSSSCLCHPHLSLRPLRLCPLPTPPPQLPLPTLLPSCDVPLSLHPSLSSCSSRSAPWCSPHLPCPALLNTPSITAQLTTQLTRYSLGANPYLPTGYVVSTWWVLKQNTQNGPTGFILITFVIHPQFTHPNTHRVHVEYFQKVPNLNDQQVPGWVLCKNTQHVPGGYLGGQSVGEM